jgi:hypothetical protein
MFSFFKRILPSARRRAGIKNTFRPSLETLEGRDLPSITLVPNTGIIVASGNSTGHDIFDQGNQNGQLQLRQTVGTTTVAQMNVTDRISQIVINGGAGDYLYVRSLPSNITLTSNDVEVVSVSNSGSLAGVQGNIVFTTSSGGPKTAVSINGSADDAAGITSITLTPDQLSGLTLGTADFSHARLSSLTVRSGSGIDFINVVGTKAPTTLYTGGGSDLVLVGYSHDEAPKDLTRLTGKLTVNGGGDGDDILWLDDTNTPLTNVSATVTADNFTRQGISNGNTPSTATIDYHGFDDVAFFVGGTTANVRIKSTAAVTSVELMSSVLPILVGNDAHTLDEIHGQLFVDSKTGASPLVLDDTGTTTGHHYNTISFASEYYIGRAVFLARDALFDGFGRAIGGVGIEARGTSIVALSAGNSADTFGAFSYSDGSSPAPLVGLNGGGGSDTLIAPAPATFGWLFTEAMPTTFIISGQDSGTTGSAAYTSIENLKGDSADDTFVFQKNAQGVAGKLSGTIDGGGGINTLDYSALTTGVTVDLALRVATGVFNNAANGIANIRNVIGSKGDDLLRGDDNANDGNDLFGVDGNDILIGLAGNDKLDARGIANVGAGTTRRCILIGGNGADTLNGSEGEDILLGGYFENNLDFNNDVLRAFMNVWKDTSHDYASRTRTLNDDGVSVGNTTYKITDSSTHIHDDAEDQVFGKGGTDWFWTEDQDTTDRISGQEELRDV